MLEDGPVPNEGATAVHQATERKRETETVDNEELLERVHGLETAQATQAATTAGMAATQTATTAGMQAAQAAAQAGTWAVMMAGSAGVVLGVLLGMAIAKAKS